MPATLHCRRCDRMGLLYTIRVERGVQKRHRGGKLRDVVTATCSNGHEWWSVAKTAIARSRRRDARANLKLQDEEA
jgi:hypothetical protein